MKLEDQVCSLDLAKRLKELGVKQESFAFWRDLEGHQMLLYCPDCSGKISSDYAAFTVAELGEMLPLRIDARSKKDGRKHVAYYLDYQAGGFLLRYSYHLDTRQVLAGVSADTEADARAKMLIYLIENKLITV
jgi:hypothetical protein